MYFVVLSFTLLASILHINAWHSKFLAPTRIKSIQSIQQKGFSVQRKFNIPSRPITSLKFKTSESEVDEVDVDEEVVEFDDAGGSPILKKLSKGMPIVAASLGFAITPSSAIAFRVAGAAAGGLAGFIAKNMILERMKGSEDDGGDDNNGGGGSSAVIMSPSVQVAIERIQNGPEITSLSQKTLEKIAKKFRIPNDNLGEFFSQVFSEAILAAVLVEEADITELSDVMEFAESIGLSPSEVGDGFALAAGRLGRDLGRDERGFFSTKHPRGLLMQASKMFFLADKLLGETEGFYGKRLAVSLSFFTNDDFKAVITEVCEDLFKRCVEGVITSPDDYSSDTVEELKKFLNTTPKISELRPAVMQNMIMEALQLTLNNALDGSSSLEAEIDNYPELMKAQSILGWNPREFTATLETRTLPVFEDAARQIVKEVIEHPENVDPMVEALEERIAALNVDQQKARVYLMTLVSEQNTVYMNQIDKVYNASGGAVEPAFKIMAAYTDTHAALKKLTDPIMNGAAIPVPGLPFAEMVRVSMYRMNVGKGRGLAEGMFELTEEQKAIVRKNLALPKITSWINQCISEGNLEEMAKNAYQKLLKEYDISEEDWQSTAIDFYYQDAQRISKARAVPTSVDMDRLSRLKDFLSCNDVSVSRVNMELLGDKYVKALTESMMPTGVITEEYLDGLERLRLRLALTVEDAQTLLGVATRMRITPVVKDLINIWKSDTGAAQRDDKEKDANKEKKPDKSGDMISSQDNLFGYMESGAQKDGGGPNVFMREALNLVDFFVSNYVNQDVDLNSLDAMPVTAVGVAPEKELTGMFKHFLITRLSEQDSALRQRYAQNEKVFALVLGILPEGQVRVKESLSYTAYKNMLKNVLKYKETVDPQDLQQFMVLKESLELDQVTADKVLDEASRGAVIEHAASFLRPKDGVISAGMARRFRNQVQSLGLDMQKDTGFNPKLVTYLYALEVQQFVKDGEEASLGDVQEAYDIPQNQAEEIVEESCKRYVSQLLNLALRAAKKYDEADTVQWVAQIAKYAVFISSPVDADGNLFTSDDKKRMINFYEASLKDAAAQGQDIDLEISDKLRSIVNLTEEFQAPVDGIEGLLSKVGGMASGGGR